MGMNSNYLAKYATRMESRVREVVNGGIREQQSQLVIIERFNAVMKDMHPEAPFWLGSRLQGILHGSLEVVCSHLTISGWSLIKPWRGSLFLRTWRADSRQGSHEPKLDWNPPCFDDVQQAGILFGDFEQEYCDMHGFYWPGGNPQTKPFSQTHVTKKVKVTP